jgi:hypothetical protein
LILPLLKAPTEGFFWNVPEFVRRIRFDVLNGYQFLAKKSIPLITQPPYSPDLALSDFWLFSTLKIGLKGTRFAPMEDIKSNATAELREIPKEAFCRCFQQWQNRCSKCVCVCAFVYVRAGVRARKSPTLKVIR